METGDLRSAEVEFVERIGLMSEEDGLPRIAGRIMGLLMLSEEPRTLDDLAETLQVSKASASTNTRLLDRIGMVDRTSRPGDRRAYYRIAPDALERSLERMRRRTQELVELVEEVLPEVPSESARARGRLTTMVRWHRFVLQELTSLQERWEDDDE